MFSRTLRFVFLTVCFTISSQASAGLIITEVMFNPLNDSLNPFPPPTEWVELFNTGPGDIQLDEYRLVNGNGVSFGDLTGTLGSNRAIVLYDKFFAIDGPPVAGVFTYDLTKFATKWGIDQADTLALDNWQPMANASVDPNISKTLRLIEIGPPENELVSLVRFDLSTPDRWPYSIAGHSMYLSDLTDPSPGNWLTTPDLVASSGEVKEFGNPGIVDFSAGANSLPEPSSFAIFTGVLCVSTLGRRRRRPFPEC